MLFNSVKDNDCDVVVRSCNADCDCQSRGYEKKDNGNCLCQNRGHGHKDVNDSPKFKPDPRNHYANDIRKYVDEVYRDDHHHPDHGCNCKKPEDDHCDCGKKNDCGCKDTKHGDYDISDKEVLSAMIASLVRIEERLDRIESRLNR